MQALVTYKTPDGVTRPVRFTFGALRRIVERLGCTFGAAFQKYSEACLPEIVYCCLYDRDGKPPEGLDPVRFAEECESSVIELLQVLHDACPPGDTKNLLRAALQAATLMHETATARINEIQTLSDMITATLSTSTSTNAGASPSNVLEFQSAISGSSPLDSSINSASDTGRNDKSSDSIPA